MSIHLCEFRKHDWTGEYKHHYLFLDCTKCDAKGIEYHVTDRELSLLTTRGGRTVNDLYIDLDANGKLKPLNDYQRIPYNDPELFAVKQATKETGIARYNNRRGTKVYTLNTYINNNLIRTDYHPDKAKIDELLALYKEKYAEYDASFVIGRSDPIRYSYTLAGPRA